METWKTVPCFENYEASTFGRIRRADSKQVMRETVLNSGYLGCTLHQNGNRWSTTVHRVIATTFIGSPDIGQQTNHKDGNRTNNRPDNLEWVSCSENQRHMRDVIGKNRIQKLTRCAVEAIRKTYSESGESYSKLAAKYGVSKSTIGHIITRFRWQ